MAFSLFVCVATGGASARAPGGQIDFTPHVTLLPQTPTPESIEMPWTVFEPGSTFTCPIQFTLNCPPGLATYHGDEDYGWGELAGRPDLALIWITDRTGTHYVIVSTDDPQLQGSERVDDFADLIESREAALEAIESATSEANSTGIGAGVVITLLLLCPETAGVTCLGAGIAVGGAAIVNILRNYGLREAAQEDLALAEMNIMGRYNQILQAQTSQ